MHDRRTLRSAIGAICLLVSGCAARNQPVAERSPPVPDVQPAPDAKGMTFIVWCDCAKVADRQRIATDTLKAGATVLYVYDSFPAIAVAAPPGTDPDAVTRMIARISGVTDVRRSGVSHLQTTAGTTS